MSEQDLERNRLRLQLDQMIQEINKRVINPEIPKLRVSDLEPILTAVANARAAYLNKLFEITKNAQAIPEQMPIEELEKARKVYEELLHGSQALEAAIERGYLDVMS